MKALKVFDGVDVPLDYAATMKYAVLAKSNGGKTYLTLKFEEQLCDAGAFFVTLDPVGKHWALRAGADGSAKGGKPDVFVLGGMHGDIPLESTAGALIADTVVDHPGRYVLDVSTFETDAEQDRFATDFAKRLFRRKAKTPGFPLLLIMEEAESFIPQQPRPNQAPMLGAFGRIARQGRNHGLGLYMVAQRSAALNKGVLSQADVLVVKEMSHKRDRDAVDDWVEANGTKEERDEIMASLASLSVEDAWVWSPSWLKCFKRTRVLPRVTYDSSASVMHGTAAHEIKLTSVDLAALADKMSATIEKAKAEDPKELRKRIATLERERTEQLRLLEEARADTTGAPPFSPEEYARAFADLDGAAAEASGARDAITALEGTLTDVLSERLVDHLECSRERAIDAHRYVESVRTNVARWGKLPTAAALAAARTQAVPPLPSSRPRERPVPPAPARTTVPPPRLVTAPQPPREPSQNGAASDGQLGRAERRILSVLAQFPDGRTHVQLAMLTGYSHKSGGFRNALSKLRSSELIDRGDPIRAHAAGVDALAGDWEPLPTGTALFEHWQGTVGKAERTILDVLRRHGSMDSDQLAELSGYSASSGGYRNALSRLRTLQLITRGQPVELGAELAEAIA